MNRVDYARPRASLKRGGQHQIVPLNEALDAYRDKGIDILALDESLNQLKSMSPRQFNVVSLRFFGGMSMPEVAEHLDISLSTAESDWRICRAWLRARMSDSED